MGYVSSLLLLNKTPYLNTQSMKRMLNTLSKGNNFETYMPKNIKLTAMITCEHAGNELPDEIQWGETDLKADIANQHWGYDPGSKIFALELGQAMNIPVVTSRYSRLFVDVNRPVASRTLARRQCDSHIVAINKSLSSESLMKRINDYYLPYHFEIERVAQSTGALLGISVHTFNPVYEGKVRDFEIGVLYSTSSQKLVENIVDELNKAGISSKVNAPWSGKAGFMHAIDAFTTNSATPEERSGVMFEFRNDVCQQSEWRKKVLAVLTPILSRGSSNNNKN